MRPHEGQPVVQAGAPPAEARAVVIMVHGRGASPQSILELAPFLAADDVAFLAPAAAGGTWYPFSFLSERSRNEPGISSGLGVLESLVTGLLAQGRSSREVALVGFSQGACLAGEFAVRNPRRYGGVALLSGGLIGPPGTSWDDVAADLDGTPVFLGCSDVDAHVPAARVLESEAVFRRLGADVTRVLYPGMGHMVNDDEIARVRGILAGIVEPPG